MGLENSGGELQKNVSGVDSMKKILLIADVPNWAWGIKSRYIKKYLSNEFEIDIVYLNKEKKFDLTYDIYFSYSPYLMNSIKNHKLRKITGLTGKTCYTSFFKRGENYKNNVCALHTNNLLFFKMINGKNHDRVYHLPNGIDIRLFTPKNKTINERKLIVGYVGKIRKFKGYNEYIKPVISQSSKITRLMEKTGSPSTATSHEKMPDFYRNIDVYIVAAEDEGTPNPALEAAACGKPIISNYTGNMPEFIKDGINGFLVKKDVSAYVEKLIILYNNPNLLKRMGEEARKTAETWNWKIQAENYRKMFRECLRDC